MFDLSQLRCFVTVAEELHFGRAAARLNMTQPPLSRQIQVLEHIVEAPLLDRTSRSVRLTPAGRSFLPEARRILKLAESASQVARRIALGKTGSIKIGFTATCGLRLLAGPGRGLPRPPAGGRSLAEGNGVRRPARGAGSPARSMSACCGRRSGARNLRPCAWWPSRFLPRFPDTHPRRSAETLSLKDFDGQPFVMYSPYKSRYFHDLLVVTLFTHADTLPRYVQHLSQIHSILAMVRAGLGACHRPGRGGKPQSQGVELRPLQVRTPRRSSCFWSGAATRKSAAAIADRDRGRSGIFDAGQSLDHSQIDAVRHWSIQ